MKYKNIIRKVRIKRNDNSFWIPFPKSVKISEEKIRKNNQIIQTLFDNSYIIKLKK